ncbi:MAG: cupredoxin domain-containing protein [Thaumarchaeota archaeon]|nr:cupredoxin domain-containing protein [Nitrososphaerota archaeon]
MQVAVRRGSTSASVVTVLLLLVVGMVALVYVTSSQSTADQVNAQNQSISSLQSQVLQLLSGSHTGKGTAGSNLTLPVMNQTPTIRTIRETWFLSPSAHQDRFEPSFIVVNQGDIVRLTLIDNDTVAHDFVIGPPYNIIVNATVPGLINDLTGQTFTTQSKNNSPGVVVTGAKGNVTAYYSFVASFSGIYEFVCTYHAQVGMIGYLVVLPNAAFMQTTSTSAVTTAAGSAVAVSIASGAATPPNKGFTPDNITLVIGVNNTVTWTNNDSSIHTVTANDGSFDSGYLNPGDTFTHVFTKAGVYEYHCQLHPWMIGYVTVKSA